jgi:hypothetical protein
MDPFHLSHLGAVAFSDDLAAALNWSGQNGGWVPLPPYRERRRTLDVEDVNESALAITARGVARRSAGGETTDGHRGLR